MTIQYTNHKGETCYLHKGTGKKGSSQYSFSKREKGAAVESIPEGYEIYEDPNGKVFLRKIVPEKITQEEISVVESSIRQYAKPKDYKIEVKGKAITVFLPDQEIEDLRRFFDSSISENQSLLDSFLKKILTYSPVMRFILTDEKERNFHVERAEFVNDDWYFLDGSKNLQKLAKKYCRHLGRDSLYDLL
jgi:hypothetical protein